MNLNWTLLNVSRSRLHFDIMVRWEPPPSAAVDIGWMSLVYQIQYRLVNMSHWDMVSLQSQAQVKRVLSKHTRHVWLESIFIMQTMSLSHDQ